MSDFLPITRTKIIVPRRRDELLSRKRLLELIDELLDNRLIIVAAPAGYGKTSLLVDFANSSQWPVCWYSLDTLDLDPQRFIAHFISAIRQRFPGFGKTCMAALQSMGQDRIDLDLLVSLITNDAYDNITEHFMLVLDDFHLVESNAQVRYFVNRFLQDVDENCHLVLASRALLTLPDLPLMVARSQVGGLSFEELCFQADEIQGLLQQNYQIALTDTEAAELARDTEGWVTGLLLSTQVKGKTFANRMRVARVSGVGLYEYLAQQVLEQQPDEVKAFLLRSSLMVEFDENLCEEVIGHALGLQSNWQELMDAILRLNLFVLPVGEEGNFLRYHHLFQDFLRERVRRERRDETRKIMLRMAEVYEERADWERAYAYYHELGESDRIVQMVERAGSSMIILGRLVTLTEWLESLPKELLSRYPSLISLQGAVAVTRGENNQGLRLLDQAIAEQLKSGDKIHLSQSFSRRSVAHRLLGEYREALNDAEAALAQLPEGEISVFFADALSGKATALIQLGKLNDALVLLFQVIESYRTVGDLDTASKIWTEIGRVYRTLGKYQEAEDAYRKALEHYQAVGNPIWQAMIYNNLGVLQHTRSDYVEATQSFEKAIQYAKLGGSLRLEAYALSSIGDLYQELDAVQETLEAYRQAREIAQRIQDGYLMFYLNLVEARLRQTLQETDRAQELLSMAQSMSEARGSRYELNLCRVEWGRLRLACIQYHEALGFFQEALEFFILEGYQVEIARARLYVLLASQTLGDWREVAEQIAQLRPSYEDLEKRKLIIAAGREILGELERIRDEGEQSEFIAELIDQIEQYNQDIPGLRRTIRRHAVIVPFAPPKMTIRSLGKVQVKVSDRLLTGSDWQVQTARDLFFLILAHPEGLTKEQIGEIFWPDSSPAELKLRFKNTMYRLRHAAGKDAILFQGESLYLFNRGMDYEYDLETFIKEISQAEKANDREQKEAHYLNGVKTYKGPFLPDVDAPWVNDERRRLGEIYFDALLKLAELHRQAQEFELALSWCQRALKEDPCQEDAHRLAMRIYAAMGNRAQVIRQYEQCRLALLEEVDAEPSSQTQKLFEVLTQ